MKDINELRWVRVFTPDHVPHYLVEQVRDRDFTVDEFFRYHQINCMTQGKEGIILNPFSHLYVLVDPENKVQGMLWFTVDALSKDMVIQTYSMDKNYWGKGFAVKKLSEHIKEIRKKANLPKIYWVTNYPKHSERYGFKRSKSVLMEYTEEGNGKDNDGVDRTQRKSESSDTGTAGISGRSIRTTTGPGESSGTSIQPVSATI